MLEAATDGRISDDSMLHRIKAHRVQLEAYERVCRDSGAAVAVAWLLHNPVVSTTIVGAMTIEDLQSDLDALSVQPHTDVIARLDRIRPGPGKPAAIRLVRPSTASRDERRHGAAERHVLLGQ